jgi:hypothetical protein
MKAVQWFQLYWILVGTILMVFAAQLWVRGTETSFKSRLKIVLNRFTLKSKLG